MRPIHVVVPVYRGVRVTRHCLESLIRSMLPADCMVTLIDDASPEADMTAMLKTFVDLATKGDNGTWSLLQNPTNRGFVASANIGMSLHPNHDVILLNSDTEVAPCWAQRLQQAAYGDGNTGTVTPFSNNGSLASYPLPNVGNELPRGYTVDQLDRLFREANAGLTIKIPTGVGFCLYIRRDCLEESGPFDEGAFGRGYGEECDFCLRAAHLGWIHRIAADCFVYHRGGESFGTEREERNKRAYQTLIKRYPHYPWLIQSHFFDDSARPVRQRVDMLRLMEVRSGIANGQVVIGNTLAPTTDESRNTRYAAATELVLKASGARHFELHWHERGEGFRLWFRVPDEADALRVLLTALLVPEFCALSPETFRERLQQVFDGPKEFSSTVANNNLRATNDTLQLLELVARHSHPRRSPVASLRHHLRRFVIVHGLRARDTRWLRPLTTIVPASVTSGLRRWLSDEKI